MTPTAPSDPKPPEQPKVENVVTPISDPVGRGIKPRAVGGHQIPTNSSIVAHVEPGQVTRAPKRTKKQRSLGMRILRKVVGTILYLAFVAILVMGTPKLLTWYLKSETPMAAITSDSMWPALKRGDLVFIEGVTPQQLQIGDVVVYSNQRGFTIHRITLIDLEKGMITTKGDANNVSDSPVPVGDVIGRAVEWGDKPIRIPKLGLISIMVSGQQKK